jgi:hypothetical protein
MSRCGSSRKQAASAPDIFIEISHLAAGEKLSQFSAICALLEVSQ